MTRSQRNPSRPRAESAGRTLHLVAKNDDVNAERSTLRQAEDELLALRMAMRKLETELAGTRVREAEARHLAMHDALTGLPNQRLFRQRLDSALTDGEATPRGLALLYVDLDDFKAVNDLHGHAIGDHLLQIVARRLSHSMRADDVVCRLGGDEFCCLLGGLSDRVQAVRIAAKVCTALAAPMRLGKVRLTISASIGIALSPENGSDPDRLMRRADAAMYQSKKRRSCQ